MICSPAAPPRLLIVDDEPALTEALCDTLGSHGFCTAGFTSPAEALAALAVQPFDLLLTDLVMPGMNGIALMRAALERDDDLVAVLMTGEATIGTAVAAMQSGALDYLVKPLKISAVLPVIERALAVRRLRRERAELERALRQRTCELEQANADLQAFARSVSHDLRNPLHGILGLCELMTTAAQPLPEVQARQYATLVRMSALQMKTLFEAMLRLAQVSQREMRRAPVDLSALALEIAGELQAGAPERSVAVEVEPRMHAEGDEGLLRIALQNLLGNAWKYTGKRSEARITFTSRADAGGTVYAVADNGVGFDPALADRLFKPFCRLHDAAEFAGSGIGLSVVQSIVRRHGGRVWAEAAGGQSACFRFTLGAA